MRPRIPENVSVHLSARNPFFMRIPNHHDGGQPFPHLGGGGADGDTRFDNALSEVRTHLSDNDGDCRFSVAPHA